MNIKNGALILALAAALMSANVNSAQAKEAAYAEVNGVQKDLEEACRKIEYLNGLNKNLLRIARERANADRKLRPKKTHTGYVVLTSSEKEYRYKTMRIIIIHLVCLMPW